MDTKLKGACIIGQSGGPTAVINSSVYGAIKAARDSKLITKVLGASHGIVGVLKGELFDLGLEDEYELSLLVNTPSSELGSCRYKIADPDVDTTDYEKILEVFKKYDVRYFFYNGGNDSMDTCEKISRYMEKVGYECRVMGIPKTIDNDLFGTDHCPGFGSAAKYIATSCMEIAKDACVYDAGQITIVEIMGRNAGWLAGAAGLARYFGSGPDMVFLPEVDFDVDKFFAEVVRLYELNHRVFVAISEGIHDSNGTFISEYGSDLASQKDAFGHSQMGGTAVLLANEIKARTGAKVRAIELSLLQRCAAHCASKTDIEEAQNAGRIAVEAALEGDTGKMVAFKRIELNGNYSCEYTLMPLSKVANVEKKVPREWITADGSNVTQEFINYALPLIQGEPDRVYEHSLPRYAKLKKVLV
jgi:6-phosphofructokinase 1